MDIYDDQTYGLKTKGGYMDEYGCGSIGVRNIYHIIYSKMWFYQFINGVAFRWYSVLWCIISLLMCIGIWKK